MTYHTIPRHALVPLAVAVAICMLSATAAAQVLETETARTLSAGRWEFGNAFEFQTSADGTETAIPFGFEYGLTDRLEILVEPVPYTAIRPRIGRHATGWGDVEGTLTYRLLSERGSRPALALAAEIKFPTAHDSLIGTRLTDYTGYLILSKRFGRVDTHLNVSYTVIGKPRTVSLNNIVNFAAAAVYHPNEHLEGFGEVLGNKPSAPGTESTTPNSAVPEAAGGEVVGTVGVGREMSRALFLYLSLSYDNNNAVLVRPGLMLRLP